MTESAVQRITATALAAMKDECYPVTPSKQLELTDLDDFSGSHETLAKGFDISVAELKEWLAGCFFNAFWLVYLEECFQGNFAVAVGKGESTNYGADLEYVIARIEADQRPGNTKYSDSIPDKQNWDHIDHLAYFLFHC